MKGNEKVIAKMNDLLSDELTAVSQYMVPFRNVRQLGFAKLAECRRKARD